jgi:uncharacterized protein YkwD
MPYTYRNLALQVPDCAGVTMIDRRLFIAQSLLSVLVVACPASARACSVPGGANGLRDEVIAGINAQRQASDLSALSRNANLQEAAQGLACDNAARGAVSHVSSDGTQLQGRLRRVGYRFTTANENVFMGSGSAARAVEWWMGSSGHRANILTQGIRDIGVGIALGGDGTTHWVVNMGRSR